MNKHTDPIDNIIKSDIENILRLDKNGDHQLSKQEIINQLKNQGSINPELITDNMFTDMDTNHDGLISIDEIKSFFKKSYEATPKI